MIILPPIARRLKQQTHHLVSGPDCGGGCGGGFGHTGPLGPGRHTGGRHTGGRLGNMLKMKRSKINCARQLLYIYQQVHMAFYHVQNK